MIKDVSSVNEIEFKELACLFSISGVASGYSRYSVNTLQFSEKIICIYIDRDYITISQMLTQMTNLTPFNEFTCLNIQGE